MVNLISKNYQKGVSLYLAVLITGILLSIGLSISVISLGQIKMVKGMGDSVIAFYAADTGVEKVLLRREDPTSLNGDSGTLDNGASYVITVLSAGGEDCQAANFCLRSVGAYRGIKRAIEVEY